MTRTLFIVFVFLGTFKCLGQSLNTNVIDYISMYQKLAVYEMTRTGVPASIKLAQGILESGAGNSDLSKKSNNHFGIKCKSNWLGEKIFYDDDEAQECFRKYASVTESFIDHSNFLKNNKRYARLFELNPLDDTAWAFGLLQANYATNQQYPDRILALIQNFELHQYSVTGFYLMKNKMALDSFLKDESDSIKQLSLKTETKPESTRIDYHIVKKTSEKIAIHEEFNTIDNNGSDINLHDHSHYNQGDINTLFYKLIKINHRKATFVPKGTALIGVADKYGISLQSIYKYNDLASNLDFTEQDQILFIESKANKGAFHAVKTQETESIWQFSQEEGVKLKKLMKYNKVSAEHIFNKDDIIYLKKHKK
ncbi:MAG: glucosaminidase domain-containing protein [Alphaproteobacteria bacterium]|nr:glucosaminidase domain-containing protein [Alphaproteobacteria bacterium]